VVGANDSDVYRTLNILAPTPTWERISPPWDGHRFLLLDPHDSGTAWLVGKNPQAMVARTDNLTAPHPLSVTWEVLLTGEQISATIGAPPVGVFLAAGSPWEEGEFYFLVAESQTTSWLAHTHDRGASWSWLELAGEGILDVNGEMEHGGVLAVSAHNQNRLWFATNGGHLFRSEDGGHSATLLYDGDEFYKPVVAWGVADNPDDRQAAGSVDRAIRYSLDGGTGWALAGGDLAGYRADNPGALLFPSPQSARVYAFLTLTDNDQVPHTLFRSDDGGITYSRVGMTPISMKTPGVLATCPDLIVIQRRTSGCSQIIFLSQDGGRTWQDKSGNWREQFGCFGGTFCRGIWPVPEPPGPLVGRSVTPPGE